MFSDDELRAFMNSASDPTAAALSSIATLHRGLYRSYISAGFDEEQAFELLLVVIRGLLGAQAR